MLLICSCCVEARLGRADHHELKNDLLETIKSNHPNAVLIGRRKGGRVVVFEAANEDNIFVHETEYNRHGRRFETKEWSLLTKKRIAAVDQLWESDRLDEWDTEASWTEHLTDPEIDDLKARVPDEHHDPRHWTHGKRGYTDKFYPVLCATWNPREQRVTYFVVDTDDELKIPTRLLSERPDCPSLRAFTIKWERRRDRSLDISTGYGSYWSRSSRRDEKFPWDQEHSFNRHDDRITEYMKLVAAYDLADTKRADLSHKARAHFQQIREQWIAAAWDREKARFTDDYGTDAEDLWEDHKKSIKVKVPDYLNQSHSHRPFRSEEPTLELLIDRLVEDGVALAGKRVDTAALLGEQHGVEFTPTDDIKSFKFSKVQPESDEDADEDDDLDD